MDARVRIEMEDRLDGRYALIAVASDEAAALTIAAGLKLLGLNPYLTCGCGSYDYGGCELCNDPDTPPSTTIDHIRVGAAQ